jgi:MerR family regulatory protein
MNGIDASEMSGGEFARLWGVTPRALRFCEMRGLLSPRRKGRKRMRERPAALEHGERDAFEAIDLVVDNLIPFCKVSLAGAGSMSTGGWAK